LFKIIPYLSRDLWGHFLRSYRGAGLFKFPSIHLIGKVSEFFVSRFFGNFSQAVPNVRDAHVIIFAHLSNTFLCVKCHYSGRLAFHALLETRSNPSNNASATVLRIDRQVKVSAWVKSPCSKKRLEMNALPHTG